MNAPYGYLTQGYYRGYVPWLNRMIQFATENEYLEYLKED
jgi:hypothetical protein